MRVYLQQWREWAGLSQTELGLRFEPPVGKGTVSKWEDYEPGDKKLTINVVAAYAEALDRPISDMYRLPPKKGEPVPPSLDEMASGLDPDDREHVADTISRLSHRRAS